MIRPAPRLLLLAALPAALALPAAAQAPAPAAPAITVTAPTAPAAVKARVVLGENVRDVEFAGRQGAKVFYRFQGAPPEASTSAEVGTFKEADFELKYEEQDLFKAMVTRNWGAANMILVPVIMPILPYLDIPDNNGTELALEAGMTMMKAAGATARTGDAGAARAKAMYGEALKVFTAVGTATWFPASDAGTLRAVQCRVYVGELKQAAQMLEVAREPEVGDAAYGLYWLTQAIVHKANKRTRDAMNTAIKAVGFENKDVDVFPAALLLTAVCYEELLEYYRARDVYYEIAKLFPNTEEGDEALAKLKLLMEKGLTKEKEVSPVEMVFFGLDEDVNDRVSKFLKGEDDVPDGPVSDGTSTDDVDIGKAGEKPKPVDEYAPPKAEEAPPPPPPPGPANN
jgi:tetratricopeptide (TPR) repeat protein